MKLSRQLLPGLLIAILANGAAADSVKLLGSVRMKETSTQVKLGDVARLDGAHAVALADTVVARMTDPARPLELTVQQVRDRLTEAGVNWSRVDLSGGTVIIRPRRSGAVRPPEAMTNVTLRNDRTKTAVIVPEAIAAETVANHIDDRTVHGEVARLITSQLRTSPDHLQLKITRDQHEVLRRSINDARFDIQPLGTPMSDRLELLIREWKDDQIIGQHFVTLHPLLLTEMVLASRDIERSSMLTEADIESRQEWLPPSQVMLTLNPHQAVGRFVESRIRAGEVIQLNDVRKAELIKRGDLMMVRCLVSGVAISMQAEAMTGGGLGDVIEVRKRGERESILATITGPGEAVVELGNTSNLS